MENMNTTLEIPEGSKATIAGKNIDGKNYLVVEVENEEQELKEGEDRRVHVSDLDITIRLHELLARNKINYLNQLCYTTKDELMKYYNFGERSVVELEETMAQNGLLLFGTVPQKINTNT